MFLQNIENPVKVRNQLKRMFKQSAQYCYTWDFETRQVCGLDKSEYVASLYEVQINGLVKRCECWVKQRFIIQRQAQQTDRRNSSFESRSEKSSKSPNKSALSQQNFNTNIGNNNSNSVLTNNHSSNQNGHAQISSPLVPQHDKYVIRFESYGHSKRDRMTQSINPLSYAFDKILVDYVYLFIETEEVSKQKLIKEINRAIQNARYYDATRKLTQLEEVFNEKNTPLSQGFLNTINQKKKEQEYLNQILVQNLQVSTPKALSQSPSCSNGRVLRSQDTQKKLNQQQSSNQSNQQGQSKQKEAQQNDHKSNGKQQKEKGSAQNQNSISAQGLNDQNILLSSPQINNSHLLQPSQAYQPPANSIASQTRNRSPMINSSTPSAAQSPNKSFSLNGASNSSNNNSPQKSHVTHGSPKKVSAFNSSPSKSATSANCSDNNQSPKQTILSVITTRSSISSPKKLGNQSPQKIIQSSPRLTPSPSPKSTNVPKQQGQNLQQQPQHNFKTPSNEISTRSQTTQLISSTQDNNKQKKKAINENEKLVPQSPTPSNQSMQTRYQEQLLNLNGQQNIQNQQSQQSPLIQKSSAKSSDIQSIEKANNNNNNSKTEMEIEDSNMKQQSKEKQSPKRKALK
ncbi:hypothetical protein TTHERM_00241800 (macronuclear) [Tetrahymena thermophila SB210]|uniref:Uncharacterized protein n=1 Tax=Tetrahymena thermophila (strain SB210) TaxID=312017 RepID=I7M405_TETTS|nr:hypothetical protein TTHERM_00241800 [Tetrahymena thermophila SB210]EAS04659.2 hypothetical protein TTHERM_00241800 [Tetrahymena thermophila SB210]|eukprot:XP_001024904.2 hypothetical protein TTHERM_00241800 [Tetrahymena thermophila SB210]